MTAETIIDADGHVFEKDGEIFERVESPFCNYPELLRAGLFPRLDNWNRQVRNIFDGRAQRVARSTEDGSRFVAAAQWIDFLDRASIDLTVLYPTAGLGIGQIKEPEWAVPLSRAYNNWLFEKYLKVTPRLKGVALLPMQNPVEAAQELKRAVVDLGMIGGIVPSVGLSRLLGEHFYHPVYEMAEALNVPLTIHGGGASSFGLDQFDRAIKARTLSHPFAQLIQLTDLMFSGVFDQFPRIKFAFMEAGVGWALMLLDRFERSLDLGWGKEAQGLVNPPRAHLTSGRIFFHCELDEEVLPYAVKVLGDRALFYASDFPHQPPDDCINEKKEFRERSDLSEETKCQILRGTAQRLYDLR